MEEIFEEAANRMFGEEVTVLGAVLVVEAVGLTGARSTQSWTVGPSTLTLGLVELTRLALLNDALDRLLLNGE